MVSEKNTGTQEKAQGGCNRRRKINSTEIRKMDFYSTCYCINFYFFVICDKIISYTMVKTEYFAFCMKK